MRKRREVVCAIAVLAFGVIRAPVPGFAADPASGYTLDGPLTTRVVAGPAWADNLPIYEVNLDLYHFPKGEALRSFEGQLPVLKEMGIGIVWLMPIYPRGVEKAFGSPYCVRDFRAVNPDFGTVEDLRHLVGRAHALGMHVILDYVPNHTSWDNPLMQTHPDFYKRDASGAVEQAGPWKDVAQLDYSNHALWEYQRDTLIGWIRSCDIDGYRMDTASMEPAAFWSWLRPRLEAVKPLFMLAEENGPRDHPAFDAGYDWDLPYIMWQITSGGKTTQAIDGMLQKQAADYPVGAIRMRFIDNHDYQNMSNDGGYGGQEGVLVRYAGGVQTYMVLSAMLPGKPLIYNGQEMGNGRVDPPTQPEDRRKSPLWPFYRTLYRFYESHPATYKGEFIKIPTDRDDHVYAFLRGRGRDEVLVALNLSDRPETVTLDVRGALNRGDAADKLAARVPGLAGYEIFSGERLAIGQEVSLALGPWGYRVYAVR